MWSVGCILAELILREPLLSGKNEMDQVACIYRILGNPTEEKWPGYKSLKFAGKVPINKKHNKNTLRQKFPVMSMSEDDSMYLSDTGLDLLQKMLCYDPSKRISAAEALEHPWF
jgi:cell division cycle 2-like